MPTSQIIKEGNINILICKHSSISGFTLKIRKYTKIMFKLLRCRAFFPGNYEFVISKAGSWLVTGILNHTFISGPKGNRSTYLGIQMFQLVSLGIHTMNDNHSCNQAMQKYLTSVVTNTPTIWMQLETN